MLNDAILRYAPPPSAGQRRAIAVNLVIFFAFALTAVVMLTRTAIAANSINRDVASTIEPAVGGINHDASHLPVLDVTARLTGQIAAAAAPLPSQLGGVVTATDHINTNLTSTFGSVRGIGVSVRGIKRSTSAIRPAVVVLDRHVHAISGHARGIAGSLSTVAEESSSMVRGLSDANAWLLSILRATGPLNAEVRGIQARVPQINAHAESIANSPVLLRNPMRLAPLLGNLLGVS